MPDVFEDVSCECRWQDAKEDDLFVFRKIENYVCDVGGRPLAKNSRSPLKSRAAIRPLISGENIADHVGVLAFAPS